MTEGRVEEGTIAPAALPGVRRMMWPLVALLVVFALGLLQVRTHLGGPLIFAVILLWLAVPLGLLQTYLATIHRIHALGAFAPGSVAVRFLRGIWLRVVFGWILALVGALVVIVGLIGLGPADWLVVALAVPVYFLCWIAATRLAARELKPFYRTARALPVAVWTASLLMFAVCVALQAARGGVPKYPSLDAAIAAGREGASFLGSSAIATGLAQVAGMWNGLQGYLLGFMGGGGGLPALAALAVAAILQWGFYFAICGFIASFTIPAREYRRVLAPLAHSDVPPPIERKRLFMAAAVTAIVFGLYVSAVVGSESFLAQRPWIQDSLEKSEVLLEKIDDYWVREGTQEAIVEAGLDILRELSGQTPLVQAALDAGFDKMEANVDAYLDWYYSIFGEWARIARLLTGGMEDYLARKLDEKLMQGEPFAALDDALAKVAATDAEAQAEFRRRAEAIIAQNRVQPAPGRDRDVVAHVSLAEALSLPKDRPALAFPARLRTMGVTGVGSAVVGGAVASKVVAKLTANGTMKAAAKAVAEVAAEKAGALGAASAGAAAGAVVGSAVPIVGTAVGALIGGAVAGIAVSTGTDYLMLKLEEAINRDTQRAEIIAAIEAKRAEMHAALNGDAVTPGTP
jgi:hypothetical protein